MIKLKWAIALCFGAAIFAVQTSAAEYESEIKARQSWMQVISYNVGILGAMTRGRMDYDADLASVVANNIALATQMNNGSMWPQGSDMDSHEGTVAKAELWQNFGDASEYLSDLADASATLAANAGGGLDALESSFGAVGKTCSGCHKQFRAKK